MSHGRCIIMYCRCNVLINHITRSMVLTVMMTVCMMNSGHSRLLPVMLLLHSIYNILSVARHLRLMRNVCLFVLRVCSI